MAQILVIEDELGIQKLLEEVLGSAGHVVEVVTTGEEGLTYCLSASPDLVMVDTNLPGMSGFEVTDRLRRKDKDLRIIACAGTYGLEQRTLDCGADLFLQKPYHVKGLLETVEVALGINRESTEKGPGAP
jgi:two-component system KDP operon response regulator KdpE